MVAVLLASCSRTVPATSDVLSIRHTPTVLDQTPSANDTPILTTTLTELPATATITRTPQPTKRAPTYTPDTAGQQPTPRASATEGRPCYKATFIQDVTYRDGSQVNPGEIFLKIWRFRNDGSCEWSQKFMLDFIGGERFSGPDEVKTKFFEEGSDLELRLGDRKWNNEQIYRVRPGATVEIALILRAPLQEGRHRGYWRVVASDGKSVVLQFYVDVEVSFTLEKEKGIWSGEWEHENPWSDPSENPLVLYQQDRQVAGYYYNSDGEVFLIDASLSSDQSRMQGSFGQVWQSGWPFVLELFPGQNVFHGYFNDSEFTGGGWCGNRPGYSVPLGECLLDE
ncbi:MAG: NBR1-Ig-like domain-containing protein [Anaerolineales bacterium]